MNKFSEAGAQCCVVLCTFPTSEQAVATAELLVKERLIACCTMIPGAISIYAWEGKTVTSNEVQCFFKTSAIRIDQLTLRLSELHPYDVPEIIALDAKTTAPYSSWINAAVM